MENNSNEKRKNAISTSTKNFSPLATEQQQILFPLYFHLKKTFLQVCISLDILSWILFDLFVQYYAEQLVRLNTNVKADSEQFYRLKTGAINLLLGVSLPALLIQITGLCGVSSESSCLIATYIFGQILGCFTMTLLACGGDSPVSWYWSASALWSAVLGTTAYLFRRDVQQTKQRKKIEQLSEELKV